MRAATDLAARTEQAAAALRDAEAAEAAGRAADEEHAREVRAAHWGRMHAEVLPGLAEAMREARSAVGAAVAAGDDATSAYGAYVAAHARWQTTHNAIARGLQTFVNDLTGEPHADPAERWGRAVYPDGVQGPVSGSPDPFLRMFEDAAKDAHQEHAQQAAAELRESLNAALQGVD